MLHVCCACVCHVCVCTCVCVCMCMCVCVYMYLFRCDLDGDAVLTERLYLVTDIRSAVVFLNIIESWFYVPFKKSLIKLIFLLRMLSDPVVIDN